MRKISGGCLCGSVRYTSDAEPIMTAICHCENCQRQTGTSFSIIIGVPEDSITFHKKETLTEYIDYGQSGKKIRRHFCNKCGSPILSLVENAPGLGIIKAGTLDDKSWLKPASQFWCSTAQPWVELSEELEKHDKNPVK